jgi:hypothetical protein
MNWRQNKIKFKFGVGESRRTLDISDLKHSPDFSRSQFEKLLSLLEFCLFGVPLGTCRLQEVKDLPLSRTRWEETTGNLHYSIVPKKQGAVMARGGVPVEKILPRPMAIAIALFRAVCMEDPFGLYPDKRRLLPSHESDLARRKYKMTDAAENIYFRDTPLDEDDKATTQGDWRQHMVACHNITFYDGSPDVYCASADVATRSGHTHATHMRHYSTVRAYSLASGAPRKWLKTLGYDFLENPNSMEVEEFSTNSESLDGATLLELVGYDEYKQGQLSAIETVHRCDKHLYLRCEPGFGKTLVMVASTIIRSMKGVDTGMTIIVECYAPLTSTIASDVAAMLKRVSEGSEAPPCNDSEGDNEYDAGDFWVMSCTANDINKTKFPEDLHTHQREILPDVLVLSIDAFANLCNQYKHVLENWKSWNIVNHICIDEAQQWLLENHYRSEAYRSLASPATYFRTVCLSGTTPCDEMALDMARAMNIQKEEFEVFTSMSKVVPTHVRLDVVQPNHNDTLVSVDAGIPIAASAQRASDGRHVIVTVGDEEIKLTESNYDALHRCATLFCRKLEKCHVMMICAKKNEARALHQLVKDLVKHNMSDQMSDLREPKIALLTGDDNAEIKLEVGREWSDGKIHGLISTRVVIYGTQNRKMGMIICKDLPANASDLVQMGHRKRDTRGTIPAQLVLVLRDGDECREQIWEEGNGRMGHHLYHNMDFGLQMDPQIYKNCFTSAGLVDALREPGCLWRQMSSRFSGETGDCRNCSNCEETHGANTDWTSSHSDLFRRWTGLKPLSPITSDTNPVPMSGEVFLPETIFPQDANHLLDCLDSGEEYDPNRYYLPQHTRHVLPGHVVVPTQHHTANTSGIGSKRTNGGQVRNPYTSTGTSATHTQPGHVAGGSLGTHRPVSPAKNSQYKSVTNTVHNPYTSTGTSATHTRAGHVAGGRLGPQPRHVSPAKKSHRASTSIIDAPRKRSFESAAQTTPVSPQKNSLQRHGPPKKSQEACQNFIERRRQKSMLADKALEELESRCLICFSEACQGQCKYLCYDCGTKPHNNMNDCPMSKKPICNACKNVFQSVREFHNHHQCGSRPGYQFVGKDFAELSEYLRIRGTGCYCCFSWRCDDKNRRHIVGDRIKALLFQHKNGRSFKSTVAEIYETEEKRNDFFARFASDVTSNKKQRTD